MVWMHLFCWQGHSQFLADVSRGCLLLNVLLSLSNSLSQIVETSAQLGFYSRAMIPHIKTVFYWIKKTDIKPLKGFSWKHDPVEKACSWVWDTTSLNGIYHSCKVGNVVKLISLKCLRLMSNLLKDMNISAGLFKSTPPSIFLALRGLKKTPNELRFVFLQSPWGCLFCDLLTTKQKISNVSLKAPKWETHLWPNSSITCLLPCKKSNSLSQPGFISERLLVVISMSQSFFLLLLPRQICPPHSHHWTQQEQRTGQLGLRFGILRQGLCFIAGWCCSAGSRLCRSGFQRRVMWTEGGKKLLLE